MLLNLATAQAADSQLESKLKVGFVYNFINIVVPVNSPTEQYKLCVVGMSKTNTLLPELIHKQVHGVPVEIIEISPNKSPKGCDGLFIGEIEKPARIKFLIEESQESGVLTMSDVPSYLDLGVVFSLKQLSGRLRFDVNLKSAKETNIEVSAHLLKLAHFVAE